MLRVTRYVLRVMKFNLITIFPEIFNSYFNESIIKRAVKKELVEINIHNLRDYTDDKHRTVDDTPYGGGAGMLMKVEPLFKAVASIKQQVARDKKIKTLTTNSKLPATKIILLSAKGKKWDQAMAKKYAKLENIVLICGRYEGVDERVKKFIDEEISIGDYVLTGGEIGAMVIVDSLTRLIPGVLGNEGSFKDESHWTPGVLEYPQYTRPEKFEYAPLTRGDGGLKSLKVPKVLLSGNHKEIEKWREKNRKKVK